MKKWTNKLFKYHVFTFKKQWICFRWNLSNVYNHATQKKINGIRKMFEDNLFTDGAQIRRCLLQVTHMNNCFILISVKPGHNYSCFWSPCNVHNIMITGNEQKNYSKLININFSLTINYCWMQKIPWRDNIWFPIHLSGCCLSVIEKNLLIRHNHNPLIIHAHVSLTILDTCFLDQVLITCEEGPC